MLQEFKAFIARGNVLDLAVAVIIGGAFGTIVTSLTGDVIMPVIGAIFGGADFSNYFVLLSVPAGYEGSTSDYLALKEAGAAMIAALFTGIAAALERIYALWTAARLEELAPGPDLVRAVSAEAVLPVYERAFEQARKAAR